jgi:hypothetical protein
MSLLPQFYRRRNPRDRVKNSIQSFEEEKSTIDGLENATRGGEWEPIKIPRGNLAYIPKST